MTYTDGLESINELVVTGEFGYTRFDGPWRVEKSGTNYLVFMPHEKIETPILPDVEGNGAVLIADARAVGGGIVDSVHDPEGENETHVVVNQYARGGAP